MEDDFVLGVCRRIAELREERALTQDEVAQRIPMPLRGLQRIEAGEREPRITTLRRIAAVLDVSIVQFFEPPTRNRRWRGRPRKLRT